MKKFKSILKDRNVHKGTVPFVYGGDFDNWNKVEENQ